MTKKSRNWTYIIFGIIIILIGIALLIWDQYMVFFLVFIVAAIIGVYGIIQILIPFINKQEFSDRRSKIFQVLIGLGLIGLSIWLFTHSNVSIQILSYIIGTYQIIMGGINLVTYFIFRENDVSDRFFKIIYAVIHIIVGLITIFVSLTNENILTLLAIYIIFIGLTYINDGRGAVIKEETSKKAKRRMRFPLPVIFQALLPQRVIRKVNQFIEEELYFDEEAFREKNAISDSTNPDNIMKIHVSAGTGNTDIVGHTNIVYKDIVYTYGNHDVDSRRASLLIGDGVIALCDIGSYLDFTLDGGTTIIEYEIVLTDAQVEQLENQIEELMDQVVPWEPETPSQWDSHAGNLLHNTNTQLYKFTEGKYKTYFALGTNCVMLTDDFIGISGLDLFPMVGVLTPGTYYDYLDKEYEKQDSIVINRNIYNKDLYDYLLETGDHTIGK